MKRGPHERPDVRAPRVAAGRRGRRFHVRDGHPLPRRGRRLADAGRRGREERRAPRRRRDVVVRRPTRHARRLGGDHARQIRGAVRARDEGQEARRLVGLDRGVPETRRARARGRQRAVSPAAERGRAPGDEGSQGVRHRVHGRPTDAAHQDHGASRRGVHARFGSEIYALGVLRV